MRITKIDIPKSVDSRDGLEDIKMDKLGQIVLIAGKNGSGKTRILNKIFTTLKSKPTNPAIDNVPREIESLRVRIRLNESLIQGNENELKGLSNSSRSLSENGSSFIYLTS
jgi:ABC-type Na+ transport system ATPase subunit NatA